MQRAKVFMASCVCPAYPWKESANVDAERAIEMCIQNGVSLDVISSRIPKYSLLASYGVRELPMYHAGLYMGNGVVCEYGRKGVVSTSMDQFVAVAQRNRFRKTGHVKIHVLVPTHPVSGISERLDRVKETLSSQTYHLLLSNCEHFVRFVLYGRFESYQTQTVVFRFLGSIVVLLVASWQVHRCIRVSKERLGQSPASFRGNALLPGTNTSYLTRGIGHYLWRGTSPDCTKACIRKR